MPHKDEVGEEVDIIMNVSEDSKTITLTFTSKDPFNIPSFLMELESYLHDLSRAADQSTADPNRH